MSKATTTKKAVSNRPKNGTVLKREYKGKKYEVKVMASGFRMGGKEYTSLTAIAKEITGAPAISGPRFFGLDGK